LSRDQICNGEAEEIDHSGTFEPWLAGDRQSESSVAKARNPCKGGFFEVSLS